MQALDLVVTWLWSFIFCLGIFIVLVVAICFAGSKRSFVVIKNFATDLVVFGLLFLICLLSWIGGSLCLYQLLVNDCPIKVCIQNFHYVWVATFGQNVDFCEEALQALTFVHHLFRAHYLNSNLLVRFDINCQLDLCVSTFSNGLKNQIFVVKHFTYWAYAIFSCTFHFLRNWLIYRCWLFVFVGLGRIKLIHFQFSLFT